MSEVESRQESRAEEPGSPPAGNNRVLPGVGSLRQLAAAIKDGGLDSEFAQKWQKTNGEIRNSYFTRTGNGCAVVTRSRWRRKRRQVLVWSDEHEFALQVPEFDRALNRTIWLARETDRGTDRLLPWRSRKVIADLIFTVAVPLLRVLGIVAAGKPKEASTIVAVTEQEQETLRNAAKSAEQHLDLIKKYLDEVELQAAIRRYLYGLPLGFGVVLALTLPFGDWSATIGADANHFRAVALAGGLGSITSVMMRITTGQTLTVESRHGPIVTVVSGAFRTLVGSVFGIAFYVLVEGDLLPLDNSVSEQAAFYAGLAFLAGFSERWAQDTILRSAPIPTSVSDEKDKAPGSDKTKGP